MEILSRDIPIFKSVFHFEVDKETEKELSLPDYCPDITKLIRIDATPYIESSVMSGEKCTVEGIYVVSLLYESDCKSALSFSTFNVPFSEKTEIKSAGDESIPMAKMVVKRIGCKLITPRKFSLRLKSGLNLSVKSVEKASVVDVERAADNLLYKKESCVWYEKEEKSEYEFKYKETFKIPENLKPIDDAVMNTFCTEEPDCIIADDKVHIKTSVCCKILYSSEESRNDYIMFANSFPITMICDDTDLTDVISSRAEAQVTFSEISVDVDSYGENRVVEASFTVKAKLFTRKKKSAFYATDAFFAEIPCATVTKQFTTLTESEPISRVFTTEKRFVPENVYFISICDYTSRINDCKITVNENGTFLSGIYVASFLGLTENGYMSCDEAGEFSEKISAEKLYFDEYRVICGVTQTNATLSEDGNIYIKLTLKTETVFERKETFNAVTEINSKETQKKKGLEMLFYFPKEKDDLWSISKKYFVHPHTVSNENPDIFDGEGKISTKAPVKIIIK